jgi:putative thiazole/oxazole-modified microcin (TOMM)-like peptide
MDRMRRSAGAAVRGIEMESYYVLGDEDRRKFAKIAASEWMDDTFARRYAEVPYEVLTEHGITYPADVAPPMLPPRPEGELSVETLESIAAGVVSTAGTAGTAGSVSLPAPAASGGFAAVPGGRGHNDPQWRVESARRLAGPAD